MKKVIALVITASIVLGNAAFVQANPLNTTQRQNAEDQLNESKTKLEASETKLMELEVAIEKLDNEIESLMSDLEENKKAISKSEIDINLCKKDVLAAETAMKKQQELFDSRMRALYKNGSQGYLSIILKSENFSDLVTKVNTVNRMISFDKKVADDLAAKREVLIEKQKALELENEKLIYLKKEKEDKLNKLNSNKADQKKLIDEVKRQQSLLAENVKKDQESVNNAISNMDNQAISIATNSSSSTADIQVAIKYLEDRYKVSKSSRIIDAITKGKDIISSRNSSTAVTTQPTRGNSNNSTPGNYNNKSNYNGSSVSGSAIALYAQQFLGDPYLWGGTRPYSPGDAKSGFDCSGLVQYCYKQFGISITRTCATQIKYDGRFVDKDDLVAGDLIYFGTWDNPHHVGMYIGNGCFIHAPRTGDVIKIQPLSVRNDFLAAKRIIN